jgi:hypothetical protein
VGFLQRARDAVRIPEPAATAIQTGRGERLLTWARDEATGSTVVASNHCLYAVIPSGEVTLARAWHLVDAGIWDHDTFTLTVSWVDAHRPAEWLLREPSLVPETVRERVQASVVLAERVALGDRGGQVRGGQVRGGQFRVVIRQDFATGDLLEQVILGRGVAHDQPGVAEATAAARARLREQVGLV